MYNILDENIKDFKHFHLSVAEGVRQNPQNKIYDTDYEITDIESLKKAVQYDHTEANFRENERSNEKFISTDCIILDVDNDHSENSNNWFTPEKIATTFTDVQFSIIYSRNNNKIKGAKTARPRFHIYFPLSKKIEKATEVRSLKEKIMTFCIAFDKNAKDAARFIYGVENPTGEFFKGSKCIDEFAHEIELTETKTTKNEQNITTAAVIRSATTNSATQNTSNAVNAWDWVHKNINLVDLATSLGISLKKSGNEYRSDSIDGNGGHGAFCIYTDTNSWYDFKIQQGGSAIELLAYIRYNGDIKQAMLSIIPEDEKNIIQKTIHELKERFQYVEQAHASLIDDIEAMNYLHGRKITSNTIENLKIGVTVENGIKRIVIPIMNENGEIVSYASRALNDAINPRWKNAKGRSWIFGLHSIRNRHDDEVKINDDSIITNENFNASRDPESFSLASSTEIFKKCDVLVLCEGIFDAIDFIQSGYSVLCSCGGTFKGIDLKYIINLSRNYKYVMLAFDNDKAGQKFSLETCKALYQARVKNVMAALIPEQFKDIAEYYEAGNNIDHLTANAYEGIRILAGSFCVDQNFEDMNAGQQDRVLKDIRTYLFEAARFMSDDVLEKFLMHITYYMKLSGDHIKLFKKYVKEAREGLKEAEITDAVLEQHELLFNEKTGFFEYDDDRGLWVAKQETEIQRYVKDFLERTARNSMMRNVTNHIKAACVSNEPLEKFNTLNLLSFKNGTLHLDTGKFTPHANTDFATIQLEYNFDKNATSPKWLQFIQDITDGDNNRASVLKQFAGYVLFPDCSLQRVLCLIGNGANGKSTFLEVLRAVFGSKNSSSVEMYSLGLPFQSVLMRDKLLNICTETRSNLKGAEATFKKVSCGEPITDSYKGKDVFEFTIRAKMLIATNELPKSNDKTDGFMRRWLFVNFPIAFVTNPSGSKQKKINTRLKAELLSEKAGIFNWILEGYNELVAQGDFIVIEDQQTITDELKTAINPLIAFVEEIHNTFYDDHGRGRQLARHEIYELYRKWSDDNGFTKHMPSNKFHPDFRLALASKGITFDEKRLTPKGYHYIF